jgi:hypothetical protein
MVDEKFDNLRANTVVVDVVGCICVVLIVYDTEKGMIIIQLTWLLVFWQVHPEKKKQTNYFNVQQQSKTQHLL